MPAEFYGVPTWWRPYVVEFVKRAYPIGEDLNVAISSFHRTRSKNTEVGGAESSQHLLAIAWDVVGPDVALYAARARRAGLVVVEEGDHVHVQRFARGVLPASLYDAVAIA